MSLLQKIIFGTEFEESPLLTIQCLMIIEKEGGISFQELASKAGLSLSSVSKIISYLEKNEKKPLVKVSFIEEGSREKYVQMTSFGNEVVASFDREGSLS